MVYQDIYIYKHIYIYIYIYITYVIRSLENNLRSFEVVKSVTRGILFVDISRKSLK